MKFRHVVLALLVVLVVCLWADYYLQNRGFTPWMTYEEMDRFLEPLDKKDENGKNFWDHRHWLDAAEGRWYKGRPQFRLRVVDAPKTGRYSWYWWFNQDEKSINDRIHDMSDKNMTLVSFNSFEWPDGTKRYTGVWHRIGGPPEKRKPAPPPTSQAAPKDWPKLIVGKWRDENSLVVYRSDGTKIAKYDSGVENEGRWLFEGPVVVFTPTNAQGRSYPTRQKVLSLTETDLVIEDETKRVYHARRVP